MISEQQTAKQIFVELIGSVPPDQWNQRLSDFCQGNDDLLRRVQALLKAHRDAGSFLAAAPSVFAVESSLTTAQHPHDRVGTIVGRYKLLEQIGEGGMGVVFVAEQTEPVRRRVALKIIKPGMDTKQVIARFEAERQALAMMDHPNIARVLDAGTTEAGRPYFVMELVRGMPITEYCDKARLSPLQRLELFVDVCQAVQHAHQKGIIHRDLKPSNVMITLHDGVPVVKVIDFGVAKAVGQQLTERTIYTALTQLVGTPLYMSPEQAEMSGLDVDTRSDVYSLGVLLYELLTGQTPFDKEILSKAGLDEMRRIIREDEPLRPSRRFSTLGAQAISTASQHRGLDERRLSKILCGELDWIVMKALEKDRSRRYESASALATDIQRYLSDEPVQACPPTTMYRFQKFARKHKPALATAAAIALCLILGTTVSAWQAARATTAEAQANANEQKAVANAATAHEKEREAIKQRDEVKALADKLAAKDQQLKRTLYAAHMNLAHNAFEAGAPARLRELLAQHHPQPGEPDLRGFEWHYLNRLVPADLLVLEHSGWVRGVAYSPDGKRLATASWGNTLKLWDAQTGKELISVKGEDDLLLLSVAFSPDGKRVASGSNGEKVKIWDAQTLRELLTFPAQGGAGTSIAFSPDGKKLAGSSSRGAKIWDAQTGEQLLKLTDIENSRGLGVAFSPDGKRLAASASEDNSVKLWDAETGEKLQTLLGHTAPIRAVAFSPDGKQLASASLDRTVKLWDARSGKELRTLPGHTGEVLDVTFSPDGKQLASASIDNTVKVWDTQTGEELFAVRGHSSDVQRVIFSPDGKHLASASGDRTVKVRQAKATRKALGLGGGSTDITKVAFGLDGKRLVSEGRGGELEVWDTKSGEKVFNLNTRVGVSRFRALEAMCLSADGRRAATLSRTELDSQIAEATVWDLQTGNKVNTFAFSFRMSNVELALSLDGRRLAAAKKIWSGPERRDIGEETKIWDVQTGEEFPAIAKAGGPVIFSPDGQHLAGYAEDKTVKLWNVMTGDEVLSINGPIGCLAFSPGGKRLASGSSDATVAKVWDAQTGNELLSLKGHSGTITGVAFSPDDKRMATTSSDATIKLWDSESGQELLTLPGHSGRNNGVAFSPDGNRLAAGGPNGTVMIYDATPLPEKP